jgi:hypothetical protein
VEVVCVLSVSVSVCSEGSTLADLVRFVAEAERLGVSGDSELFDGVEPGVVVVPDAPPAPEDLSLAVFSAWVRALVDAGVDPGCFVEGADAAALDVPVVAVEVADCGEHLEVVPPLVVAQVDRRCSLHAPSTPPS